MRRFITRRSALVVGIVVLVGALVGTAATAVVTGRNGTTTERQTYVGDTAPFTTTSTSWVDVPNAVRTVFVPFGPRRFIAARFSAESACDGGPSGWCTVRIVVITPSGATVQLAPASGSNFAFDSAEGADAWESHAMERVSPILGRGVSTVKVQAAIVPGATSFWLDDWMFAVESIRV